ncbi:unnamed protein product [Amoebophrya sp. A120]|nr:unnamed protein product [Amoebophrya sp. A120]|eukprot:GSA120T00016627001.1
MNMMNPGGNPPNMAPTTAGPGAPSGQQVQAATAGASWRVFANDEAFAAGNSLSQTRTENYRAKQLSTGSSQQPQQPQPPHGLLSLQLLLRFSDSVRHLYVFVTVMSMLFKFAAFPNSKDLQSTRLGEEIPCIVLFWLIEGTRIQFGYDGNKTERCSRLAVFNLLSIPQILFLGFFFTAQVYVLRIDGFMNLSLLIVTAAQVGLTLPLAIRSGGLRQIGGEFETFVTAGGAGFLLFVVFVLFDAGQTENSGKTCPTTRLTDCTVTTVS